MGKVIAVSNQKGGVAKTTTSINLGVALARNGKRVLLVDADPQGHLSTGLGISKTTKVTLKTMMEYVIMEMEYDPYEAVIKNDEGVDIIPSNKLLSGTDISLITVEERESILKKYLDTLKPEYDFVVIDCMPSLGMLTVNAMAAADSVLIPIEPEYYALDGMVELLKVIRNTKKRYNPQIEIEGILFTKDPYWYNSSKEYKQAVQEAYGKHIKIFEQSIPRSNPIAKCPKDGVSIFAYDKNNPGAKSYDWLAKEVIRNGKE